MQRNRTALFVLWVLQFQQLNPRSVPFFDDNETLRRLASLALVLETPWKNYSSVRLETTCLASWFASGPLRRWCVELSWMVISVSLLSSLNAYAHVTCCSCRVGDSQKIYCTLKKLLTFKDCEQVLFTLFCRVFVVLSHHWHSIAWGSLFYLLLHDSAVHAHG